MACRHLFLVRRVQGNALNELSQTFLNLPHLIPRIRPSKQLACHSIPRFSGPATRHAFTSGLEIESAAFRHLFAVLQLQSHHLSIGPVVPHGGLASYRHFPTRLYRPMLSAPIPAANGVAAPVSH